MSAVLGDSFDASLLRQAFGFFPTGVMAFCGLTDGGPEGMAVSSFTSVSLVPALVSVCVARSSATWPKLARLERLGLSVLSNEHGRVARGLAVKNGDRFDGVDWHPSTGGAVFVHGASLWLECGLFEVVRAGDHEIVILRVLGLAINPDVSPMVFHRSGFHHLVPTS